MLQKLIAIFVIQSKNLFKIFYFSQNNKLHSCYFFKCCCYYYHYYYYYYYYLFSLFSFIPKYQNINKYLFFKFVFILYIIQTSFVLFVRTFGGSYSLEFVCLIMIPQAFLTRLRDFLTFFFANTLKLTLGFFSFLDLS